MRCLVHKTADKPAMAVEISSVQKRNIVLLQSSVHWLIGSSASHWRMEKAVL